MDLGVMIEGQEGLDWDLWRRIATETEALGFESLWRSDHFFSLSGSTDQPALETFVSFVLAAEVTNRLRFGSLVASATFRHPSLVARMAAQIDALSGGRFVLGVGAGWNVPEHAAFGIPFPPVKERMDRLEESIEVMRLLWGDVPASYRGRYYSLDTAQCYPKPVQRPMYLLVGGSGEKRTLRIAAKHASEWNFTGGGVETYLHKRSVLEQHCFEVGRNPADLRHSQMVGFVIGRDEHGVRDHLASIAEKLPRLASQDSEAALDGLRERGWLIGTPGEVVEELGRREEAGLSRIMLQHNAMERFDTLELLAADVLPQVQG